MSNHGKQLARRVLGLTLASSISVSGTALFPAIAFAANGAAPAIQSTVGKRNAYVEVAVNKSRVIQLNTAINRVSVSDPNIVNIVVISPTEVQIIGKGVGNCSLLVWSESSGKNYLNIDISVHQDITTLSQKIHAIDPGVQISPMAAQNAIILTGYAASREKAQMVIDLAKAFLGVATTANDDNAPPSSSSVGSAFGSGGSTRIINMIKIPGQPSTKSEMVQERLHDISPNISLSVVPAADGSERAILSGTVRSAADVSKAINVASIFYGQPGIKVVTGPGGNTPPATAAGSVGGFSSTGGSNGLVSNMDKNILQGSFITDSSGNVISLLEIMERPQIRCHIQILEVRKSVNFSSGFNAATVGGEGKLKTASTQGSGQDELLSTVNQTAVAFSDGGQLAYRFGRDLSVYIQGLITDGKARVLAEPNITTISGEPATFLAGGEFPIPLTGINGQVSVLFKEFGVRLNILPTLTERDTVHMQVSPEVSSLDSTSGVTLNGGVIPGLRTRRSQAVIEMADGENFVLSGLYNEDFNNTVQKTPFLGQIPILGELFRSRTFQNAETELVIIVRPEVLTTPSIAAKSVPQPVLAPSQPTDIELESLRNNQYGTQSSTAYPSNEDNGSISINFPQEIAPKADKEVGDTQPYGLKAHAKTSPVVTLTAKSTTPGIAINPGNASTVRVDMPKTPVVTAPQRPVIAEEPQKAASLLDDTNLDKPEPKYIAPVIAPVITEAVKAPSEAPSKITPATTVVHAPISTPPVSAPVKAPQKTASLLDEASLDKPEPKYNAPVVTPMAVDIAKTILETPSPNIKTTVMNTPSETPQKTASLLDDTNLDKPEPKYIAPVDEKPVITESPILSQPSQPITKAPPIVLESQKTVSLLDDTTISNSDKAATSTTRPIAHNEAPAPFAPLSLDRIVESVLESAFPGNALEQETSTLTPDTMNNIQSADVVEAKVLPADSPKAPLSLEAAANQPGQTTESLLSEEDMTPTINAKTRPRLYKETVDVVLENLEAQLSADYEQTIKAALNKRRPEDD